MVWVPKPLRQQLCKQSHQMLIRNEEFPLGTSKFLPGNLHTFPRRVVICSIKKYLNSSPKVSVEVKYSYIQIKGVQPHTTEECILENIILLMNSFKVYGIFLPLKCCDFLEFLSNSTIF